MTRLIFSCFLLFVFSVVSFAAQPNIVFILADDLGYGDLGCYGQQKIKTPSIDTLAKEGIRFTRHYSGNNVCAPSRAVLMTGMHPGHCVVRNNSEVQPEGQKPMPEGTVTLVGELKKLGYVSGAFGKWGLGSPDSVSTPLRIGFDRFYGYNCQRAAHTYYPKHLWDDDRQVVINENPVPGHAKLNEGDDPNDPKSYEKFRGENYSADLIADEVMRFVEKNAEKPFFLYWATTVPHLALQVPEDSLKEYQGPRDDPQWDDPPYLGDKGYTPHLTPRAAYAAMVSRMDREVGRLIKLLKEKGIYENTLIVFTSDNGGTFDTGGANTDFFRSNGISRGYKGSMYEGGILVPCIVSWAGKVQPGTVTDQMSGFEDWFPTLLEIAGMTPQDQPPCDGISFVPLLLGEQSDRPVRIWLYRESPGYGAQQTAMLGDWKALRMDLAPAKKAGKSLDEVPIVLYNLKDDPAEKTDLAARYPEKVRELRKLMDREHVRSAEFPMPLLDD
ncbi:MAG: arylsulfatase [Planctomycetaceae bacterium]|nr:arylsulfatase [Planctomycetaceae bacterium]